MNTEALQSVFEEIGRERTRRLCGAHEFAAYSNSITGTTHYCIKCPLGISEGALLTMQDDAMDILAPCPATLEQVQLANRLMGHTYVWSQTRKVEAK